MTHRSTCIKGATDKARMHLKSSIGSRGVRARSISSALQSQLRRYTSNSTEMHLALILTVAISFQIHSFTGACNQVPSEQQAFHDDMSLKDTLHNTQDSSHDDLLSLTRPKAAPSTEAAALAAPTTTSAASAPPTAISRAATTTSIISTRNASTSAHTNGTTRTGASRVSLSDIHNFRLEYNKYRILSHLSITGNLDELAPEIDPSLRDKLVTSTAISEQQTGASSSTRHKRSLSCEEVKSDKNACCLENFYVNFTHIGWDKWILFPTGYNANYCRGQCDLSHARYYHSTLLSKYSNLINLCCSPKQMAPLKLLYIDEENKVHQKSIPDMIVESCDCA